ncbi:D-alanine--D-alanine ligase A [Microgenomates group bacterium RIFCSPLOWO2_01_FULL_46_13]|nr:MAG: D-alanine--D-alanine ligase A [Microgenomates group bacterium RIFCSPHIGHO2_01_FULL_45_11]OGV94808.1 MAG: D-alanine--D-alanine ligase A [Microgenomates group bacterium RIFCSPLOWO2_01_FULL_46_13]
MKKIRVAVIYGGTNTEHEVSLVSARSIIANLNPEKYELVPITITKKNTWAVQPSLLPTSTRQSLSVQKSRALTRHRGQLPDLSSNNQPVDVVFPVIHGPFGEDGTIQGMLEMARLPYVGSNVLASALCMDKMVQKQLCKGQGIAVVDFVGFTNNQWQRNKARLTEQIEKELGYPSFVKPTNQGSSVGVIKARGRGELRRAITQALKLDSKVLVEKAVSQAREIECSVLGNDEPEASVLGEIIPSNEFYDYDAKYVDGKSQAIIPAKLPKKLAGAIRKTALLAFKLLNCSGLARVDFLVNAKTNQYYLSELNTMPGFTSISMYPKLWEATGLPHPKLLDRLIELALERHQERSKLNFSYLPRTQWYR